MTFVWPTKSKYVTSAYNPKRKHPISGIIKPHTGTDFRAATGAEVFATEKGTVEATGYDPPSPKGTGAGNYIRINHGESTTSRYYHLSAIKVSRGQVVKAGSLIGFAGSTGDSSAAHLHFEIRVRNVPIDPVPYILKSQGLTPVKDIALYQGSIDDIAISGNLPPALKKKGIEMFQTRYGSSAYRLVTSIGVIGISEDTYIKLEAAGIPTPTALTNDEVNSLATQFDTLREDIGVEAVSVAISDTIAASIADAVRDALSGAVEELTNTLAFQLVNELNANLVLRLGSNG